MKKAPEHITTTRLELRRPRARDAVAIFERYASDSEVTRYVGWPRHISLDDTRAFLDFSDTEWARWPAGPYLVSRRDDGQLLGSTGLAFDAPETAMTGYVLARDAWGFGYATESLGAMINVAQGCGVLHLYAICHPQHAASARVLQRADFVLAGGFARQIEFPNLAPGLNSDALRYERSL